MNDFSAYAKGIMGEKAAEELLNSKGMKTICKNYRVVGGEIDLIMQDDHTLVFVEVKSRNRNNLPSAEAAVDMRKRERIINSARYFLGKNPQWLNMEVRFDLVILLPGEAVHIPDAFSGMEW